MKYLRHFLELGFVGIGASQSGMSDFFGAIDPQVLQASPTLGGKYLGDRYLPYAQGFASGSRDGVQIDDAAADAARADCEVRFGFQWNGLTGSGNCGASAGVRVSNTLAAPTGYFGDARLYANQVAIVKCVAGANTDLATAAFNFVANTVYHVVLRVSGTNLSMKVWKAGDQEPAAWTITVVDAVIAGAGGMFAGSVKGTTPATTISLWYISVATGTDSSPVAPKTWQEYLDFLNLQDTLRCALVEIDPLGQTSAGAAALARVVMANYPFVSRPEDRYPNVCYEEILLSPPQTRRRMSEAFTGRSVMSYGDVIFKNEVVNPNALEIGQDFAGRLDVWFSWNWDGRQVRVLYGHPTWRRSDFKTVLLGQVQDVYRRDRGSAGFRLRGPEALFQKPASTALIGGAGANASALAPYSVTGCFFNAKAILYDANSLTYQIDSRGALVNGAGDHDVRDSGGSLKKAVRSITAVNAGTDTLTSDAAHGLAVGATWVGSGALPAPLVAGTKYYVKTVPTGTTITLAATVGGATIDITTATTGGIFIGRLYDWDNTGNRITPLSAPAGDITVDVAGGAGISSLIQALLSNAGVTGIPGVSTGLAPDIFHGQNIATQIADWSASQVNVGEKLDEMVSSVGASWNFAREGTYYLFQLDIPGSSSAWSLNSDDVRNWRITSRTLPANAARLGYKKNFTVQDGASLLGSVTPSDRDLYGKPYSVTVYAPADGGLDQPGSHLLATTPDERVTLLVNAADALAESQRRYNLRRKVTGTFTFNTGAWALAAELGDNVLLTFPRDNFAAGRNATIVGITDNLAAGGAEVEVFAQIDGQWPVVTALNPIASEAYY